MKIFVFACIAALVGLGCSVPNATPVTPTTSSTPFDSVKAQLLKRGPFVGLDGPTTGTASLFDQAGTKYVVLNPFVSHNGPDLYVYIAKDASAADYIKLGKLQAITGGQVYKVPVAINAADYTYVHIWCQMYSVDFARAEIK